MNAADKMFYERGVATTSLEAIAKSAGVTRRTLYYHFGSKEGLVEAYLRRRDLATRALLTRTSELPSPRDRIAAVFEGLGQWFRTREFRGCALTNAIGENGDVVVFAGPFTARHKRALRNWFVDVATDLEVSQPKELGEQLMLLFDGAITSARTRKDPSVARHAGNAALLLVQAHAGAHL